MIMSESYSNDYIRKGTQMITRVIFAGVYSSVIAQ